MIEHMKPFVDEIVQEVGAKLSDEFLRGLRLTEIAESFEGDEALLRFVWQACWNDGQEDSVVLVFPESEFQQGMHYIHDKVLRRLTRAVHKRELEIMAS